MDSAEDTMQTTTNEPEYRTGTSNPKDGGGWRPLRPDLPLSLPATPFKIQVRVHQTVLTLECCAPGGGISLYEYKDEPKPVTSGGPNPQQANPSRDNRTSPDPRPGQPRAARKSSGTSDGRRARLV